MTDELTHLDAEGKARMVDVGAKPDSERVAVAAGTVTMQPETLRLIRDDAIKKGDHPALASDRADASRRRDRAGRGGPCRAHHGDGAHRR